MPYTPVSHPFVERLIETVRREYLDQIFFWNQIDLQRELNSFKQYYNDYRLHVRPGSRMNFCFTGAIKVTATDETRRSTGGSLVGHAALVTARCEASMTMDPPDFRYAKPRGEAKTASTRR